EHRVDALLAELLRGRLRQRACRERARRPGAAAGDRSASRAAGDLNERPAVAALAQGAHTRIQEGIRLSRHLQCVVVEVLVREVRERAAAKWRTARRGA